MPGIESFCVGQYASGAPHPVLRLSDQPALDIGSQMSVTLRKRLADPTRKYLLSRPPYADYFRVSQLTYVSRKLRMAYGKIAGTGVHIPFAKNDSLKDTASRWTRHHTEQGRCLVKEHWSSMVVYEHGTEYAAEIRTPDLDDYMRLRKSAGLTPLPRAAAEVGIKGTLFALVIVHESGGNGPPDG